MKNTEDWADWAETIKNIAIQLASAKKYLEQAKERSDVALLSAAQTHIRDAMKMLNQALQQ
ncbi:MAG: hypothetical protein ACYCT0_02325 [Sulfobacillus sp.]